MSPPQAVLWLDGRLADPARASVHWSDHGITVGDGVFETVELRHGAAFARSRHLQRLRRSAAGLGLPVPDSLDEAVDAVVAGWGDRPGRLRITLTGGPGPMGSSRGDAGPTLLVSATPLALDRAPIAAALVPWTRNERGALAGLKTTSYGENVVALAAAAAHGAGEALFANTRGELCEGTGSNVFVARDGGLVTPPLDSGCLAGVTRALLLEALSAVGAPVEERPIPLAELGAVDELFLVSTTRHVQPVDRLVRLDAAGTVTDAVALPPGGPLTRRAQQLWDDAHGPGTPADP